MREVERGRDESGGDGGLLSTTGVPFGKTFNMLIIIKLFYFIQIDWVNNMISYF